MSINKGMFTSATDQWETPQDLYDFLDAIFEFELDPCALPTNAKCERFFTPNQDGLKQPWEGRVFMNPPYGREIKRWVQKAYNEAQKDNTVVVCLLPASTDTSWWHEYCTRGRSWFIRGRLKFSNSRNSAPFPSAIVIFSKIISSISQKPIFMERDVKGRLS